MHGYMYVYLYICLGINFHASVDCPWFLQALRLHAAGCNSTCTLDYSVYNMTLNANCGLLVCTKDSFSKCFANGHGEGESKCQ